MPPRSARSNDGEASANASKGTIATVERAVDVLLHIAERPGPDFGITELADDLSMSKAAVHRVMASLKSRGLVEVDERSRRYSLGVGALRLGLAYLDRIDVRRMGRPALERLSERTGETATLSVLLGEHERIYVDQVTPDREVIMSVTMGEPYPLHAGASGRAFLAFLPEETRETYLAARGLRALTDRTVVDVAELREVLDRVRSDGWAMSSGERKAGAASVAAPVLSHDGFPVAVVSVCGPEERFAAHVDECREELLKTVRNLSLQFGWSSAS
ncbi:IclR family transcriptional regulator [Nocardioides gansuensis]|uniref:IclR family transcriptional regulator n=1 Tax=Nocardioides gansuensis TaxID=2138300 RepID=A0A2T8F502_9ACTN|nr:IclR family transcriptional regulator [Nocardioides gansuensis]PVG80791.1 IclR family transcriptional regulator [Nocardioides gansuensis]